MALPDKQPDTLFTLSPGYVRLDDWMGTDLSVVNAAKVSFDKKQDTWDERARKLTDFLAKNGHTSPFRHSVLKFEVYAPMFVKNQWWKYVIGSDHQESYRDPLMAWNESSRRYITEPAQFYTPLWRWAPDNRKQGSGHTIDPNDTLKNGNQAMMLLGKLDADMRRSIQDGVRRYEEAIEWGVAPEQARVFLPAYAMYIRWIWTASLQGVLHLIEQRTAPDAQWEFQQYARAVEYFTRLKFPNAAGAMLDR